MTLPARHHHHHGSLLERGFPWREPPATDGVLTVTIPKAQVAKPHHVEIQT